MTTVTTSWCDRPSYGGTKTEICQLVLQELKRSRRILETKDGVSYENHYICLGTNDEQLVRCRLADEVIGIPKTFRNVPIQVMEPEPVSNNVWFVRAVYAWPGALSAAQIRDYANKSPAVDVAPQMFNFSTGGGSSTITRSRGSQLFGAAVDHNNYINYVNGKVNGVNVVAPQFRWAETWLFTYDDIMNEGANHPTYPNVTCMDSPIEVIQPRSLLDVWYHFTGSINGNPNQIWTYKNEAYSFRNWYPGEVLFLGAVGRMVSNYSVEVTFDFAVQKTFEFCVDPEGDGGIDSYWVQARGWDYIEWQYDEGGTDGQGGKKHLVPQPIGVIAHQQYKQENFIALEIGTAKPEPEFFNKGLLPCNSHGELDRTGNWDEIAQGCETLPAAAASDALFDTH